MKRKAFRAALPYTIPICVGFLFLGMSYGFLMRSKGFSVFYPMLMSMFIFAGSMEFVTVNLLLSAFDPVYAFCLTLMVNARHLFYGISMLSKYKNVGLKKFYLIFGLCDESFTINCTVKVPADVDKGWFMFFVTLLNQAYWVAGATLGALAGYVIRFDTTGIEFVMTALFVVMFLNQWEDHRDHRPALIGVGCSVLCLAIFGSGSFIIPAMALIILCFFADKKGGGMMTIGQRILTIAAVVLGTMVTRFLPFLIFPEGKEPPKFITYLGTVLPYAVIGLLVVYCLKDAAFSNWHGLPEAISIGAIVVLHKWKKNTLLSIAGGTALYMVLVQNLFI